MTQSHHQPVSNATSAGPTTDKQRLDSLDVLRGFAVLAIFAVNIKMMASGYNHYADFRLYEGGIAALIGLLQARLIDGKFVTIFTALFGAGLALLLARDKPVPMTIVVRRLFWLAVFGGIHLIFLREGDILIWYAIAGFLAVPFARLPARSLFAIGIGLQMAAYIYYVAFPLSSPEPTNLWSDAPDAHKHVETIMLGPVSEQIAARIDAARYYMLDIFVLGGVWIDTLGVMLLGMALLKTGFLSGKLSIGSYIRWGAIGLAVGTLVYLLRPFLDADDQIQGRIVSIARYVHRFGGALAWSALVIAAVSRGWKGFGLAAAGRTAFTVYILQSVIGLLLFSSLGLGLFGQLSLGALMLITLAIWLLFLAAAPLWLRYFRFGPLEWLWRSLTYGQLQPIRRA